MLALANVSCSAFPHAKSITVTYKLGPLVVDQLTSVVVTPGVPVIIRGHGFSRDMTVALLQLSAGAPPNLYIRSDREATITLPPPSRFGPVDLILSRGGEKIRLSLISNGGLTDLPVISADPSLICDDVTYRDLQSKVQAGYRRCSGKKSLCEADGDRNCRTSAALPAVTMDGLLAKVVTGQTVAGVEGTAQGPCVREGAVGCFAAQPYRAADKRVTLPGNIVPGKTVAGVAGSASYRPSCALDGGIDCVTNSRFPSAMASGLATKVATGSTVAGVAGTAATEGHANCVTDGQVGCVATANYKAADVRRASATDIIAGATIGGVVGSAVGYAACSSDGQQNCTVSGVFKAADLTAISAWDVRVGKSIGGITGCTQDQLPECNK